MRTAGLIVAAGRGIRMGGPTPKQYLDLGGASVLACTMRALLNSPEIDLLTVVIHSEALALYTKATAGIDDLRVTVPCTGGDSRRASVLAGLETLIGADIDRVLVHDAARPFPSLALIARLLDALDAAPAAFPALPVVDALWEMAPGGALKAARRDGLWRAQTPQAFRFADILAAHRANAADIADDIAAAVAARLDVLMVDGEEDNFKITTAADLERARRLAGGAMDIRIGNGFDVHAFGPGAAVTLCGVEIPFNRGLVGHSDADVAMHAITDALLGALGAGDIGRWFPPSDPQWRGAASRIFLEKAAALCAEKGFALGNIDCTIVCEAPKIGPHADAMRARLAEITGLAPERISVKATTSERLGFTGRGEGVAALATATVSRP